MTLTEDLILDTAFPADLVARFTRHVKKEPVTLDIAAFHQALAPQFKGKCLLSEPLSRHTSIKIGGPADIVVMPRDMADLEIVLEAANAMKIPWQILGAGSNTLAKDEGIRGVVISLSEMSPEIRIVEETSVSAHRAREGEAPSGIALLEGATRAPLIEVDAGYSLHALVRWTGKQGLDGVAHLAGIPATVGGALFMNAGVPAGTISDCLEAILIINGKALTRPRWIPKKDLTLGYRKNELPAGSIVLAGRFRFPRADAQVVQDQISQTLERRKDKQPLNFPSLGSVFMNPEPSAFKKNTLSMGRGYSDANPPSAGALIEDAGLKGVRVGGARISPKHANFIINEGGATAEDVLILIRLIKDKVKELTGVVLKPEIRIVGE